jgi:hypothetical protein
MTVNENSHVVFRDGNLFIDRDLYDRYFARIETVILMKAADAILILPVHNQAAGGNLLKIRNTRGDRCVSTISFLRQNGFEDCFSQQCKARWDETASALVAELNSSPSSTNGDSN